MDVEERQQHLQPCESVWSTGIECQNIYIFLKKSPSNIQLNYTRTWTRTHACQQTYNYYILTPNQPTNYPNWHMFDISLENNYIFHTRNLSNHKTRRLSYHSAPRYQHIFKSIWLTDVKFKCNFITCGYNTTPNIHDTNDKTAIYGRKLQT